MFDVKSELDLTESHEGLLIGIFDKPEKFTGTLEKLDEQFEGQLRELVRAGDISAKFKNISKVHSFGKIGAKRIWFVGLGKEKDFNFERLSEALGKAFKALKASKLQECGVLLDSYTAGSVNEQEAAHAVSEAFSLATYQFYGYKQKSNEPEKRIENITVYSESADKEEISASLTVGLAFGKSTNSARTLVNIPGNLLTAKDMAEYA